MNLRDLKSLNSIISEVTKPETQDKSSMIQEGFGNSLSAKARQVVEETEKPENEKSETKGHETAEQAMKRLARKALKRAKKKAATNEEAELDLAEGVNAKRLRVLRKHVKDGANPMSPEVKDFMARSFKKTTNANKTRIAPGGSAVKAMEVRMRKKHSAMKEKGLAESDQLDEAGYKRLMRIKKAAYKADLDSRGFSPSDPILTGPFGRRYKQEKKHSRLTRAAAELTTKVAANMARRGGASADAVRGDGSLMGKRGTFSQKAIKLANQRDKGLAKFRGKAAEGKRWASSYPTADKRASQQRYAKFDNQSRSGDFGQNNQAAMRTTYNYLKRTGKLKTK